MISSKCSETDSTSGGRGGGLSFLGNSTSCFCAGGGLEMETSSFSEEAGAVVNGAVVNGAAVNGAATSSGKEGRSSGSSRASGNARSSVKSGSLYDSNGSDGPEGKSDIRIVGSAVDSLGSCDGIV